MHSLLIVVGDGNPEEMMRPYWQDLVVPEWCEGEVTDSDKGQMTQFYAGQGEEYPTFDELYAAHGQDWNDGCWRKDGDGVWREYTTCNPKMKWDWYEVGGRFAGRLILKEGVKPICPVNFSWGWSVEDKAKVLKARPYRADVARLEDIANLDTLTAISLLKDGEWYDIEGEGFNGTPVKPYLEGLPGDTLITVVDYHM